MNIIERKKTLNGKCICNFTDNKIINIKILGHLGDFFIYIFFLLNFFIYYIINLCHFFDKKILTLK